MLGWIQLSTPQFHTDLLSSIHQFNTRTTPFQHQKSLRSTPKPLISTPKITQFNTSLSFTQKLLRSTPKTPQFNTTLSSTPKTPRSHTPPCVREKLKGFSCGTEGFLMLNWGILGAEKEWSVCVELRGTHFLFLDS